MVLGVNNDDGGYGEQRDPFVSILISGSVSSGRNDILRSLFVSFPSVTSCFTVTSHRADGVGPPVVIDGMFVFPLHVSGEK
jgi:hypothetical protein